MSAKVSHWARSQQGMTLLIIWWRSKKEMDFNPGPSSNSTTICFHSTMGDVAVRLSLSQVNEGRSWIPSSTKASDVALAAST